jgi:hypothetical protein
MVSNRVIRCTNEDGFFLEFAESGFGPFLLTEAEGLYDAKNKVYVSENSMIDGAVYQGSVAKYRNIVLHLTDTDKYVDNRDALNRLFKEKSVGTLTFWEADAAPRKIDYYVESLNSTGEDPYREHQVSLICPDPFFYDINASSEQMASWVGVFTFPFASPSTGFVFGYKDNSLIKKIQNDFAEDNIGITIIMSCLGGVTNPSITHIETNSSIHIGHSGKPFNMVAGDIVTITTETGNKHVTLTHDGVTSEINHYLTEDSVFIQLMRGSNSFGFGADSGVNNLTITLEYTYKYARA